MTTITPNPFFVHIHCMYSGDSESILSQIQGLHAPDGIKHDLSIKVTRLGFTAPQHAVGFVEHNVDESIALLGMGNKKLYEGVGGAAQLRHAVVQLMLKLRHVLCDTAVFENLKSTGLSDFDIGYSVELGFQLGNYTFHNYVSEETKYKDRVVQGYRVADCDSEEFRKGVEKAQAVASGIILTRNLVNEPANVVSPEQLATVAHDIARASGGLITVEVLDRKACTEKGMGAYLAVAQASTKDPQFIVLTYHGGDKEHIGLVGKSITFDSGGLSLKPAEHMEDMKIDMAGGAAVLGTFKALQSLKEQGKVLPLTITGILPACENMVAGNAMRPGDVVKAMNGKTVEILNTDAEGRLALADALSYAVGEKKVDIVVDLATLTGAAMVALGTEYTAAMTNNQELMERVKTAAAKEDELLWQLPLPDRYKKLMTSQVAALRNISTTRYGGAITAGVFLKEFVGNTPWVHLDIAAPAFNSGDAYDDYMKGATGWGILTLLSLLESRVQ